jgi:hypothetical protein
MRTCSTVASATDYPQIGDDVCISPDGCVMPDAADTEARSRLGWTMRESRNVRERLALINQTSATPSAYAPMRSARLLMVMVR